MLDEQLRVTWANSEALKRLPSLKVPSGFLESIDTTEIDEIKSALISGRPYFIKPVLEPLRQCALYLEPYCSETGLVGCTVYPHFAHDYEQYISQPQTFINNFSNDYKMPLTIMFSTLGLMSRRISDQNDEVMKSYIKMVTQNCYRLLRISNNIGEYAQYVTGGIDLNLKNGDICRFLTGLCGAASVLTSAIDIPLSYSIPERPIITKFDPARLAEALFNLLSNSCKYTREGNGIVVRLDEHDERVVITVSDKGTGITDEVLANIFKPYYSFNINNSAYGSTGLGLTLFKYIILQHNGTIAVRSTVDEGTTVAFSLPVVTDECCDDYLAENSADYLSDRFSVLYVQLSDVCGCPMP